MAATCAFGCRTFVLARLDLVWVGLFGSGLNAIGVFTFANEGWDCVLVVVEARYRAVGAADAGVAECCGVTAVV